MANPIVTVTAGSTPPMVVTPGAVPKITCDVSAVRGFYLYVNYTPGDESEIDITYQVIDPTNVADPTGKYDMMDTGMPNVIHTCALLLTSTKQVFLIEKPVPATTLVLDFTFASAGSPGSLAIFARAKPLY